MAVTFGLHGLPEDLFDLSSGAAYLRIYDRCVEAFGPEFTTLWASDHLQMGDLPWLECWTRLCVLASRYEQLRVGSLVLSQSYRNPALLAKMAATLQFLTDGRFVLGIGAGWHEEEYRAYGYEYGPRGVRIEQLSEVLQILTLLWQGGPVTFRGEYYEIVDAYCVPVPEVPIPILVGSGGKRGMRLAARYAQAWNWDALPDSFYPSYERLVADLRGLGRTPETFTTTANITVDFPEDRDKFVAIIPTDFPEYDNDQIIYGPTPEDAIAGLRPFVDAGVTHFQVTPSDLSTLQLFAQEVAPVLAH